MCTNLILFFLFCTVIPSTLQDNSVHLHSVTDKPIFAQPNSNSIVENSSFANNSNIIPEEEESTNKSVPIYIEDEEILSNPVCVIEATD